MDDSLSKTWGSWTLVIGMEEKGQTFQVRLEAELGKHEKVESLQDERHRSRFREAGGLTGSAGPSEMKAQGTGQELLFIVPLLHARSQSVLTLAFHHQH